MISSTDYRLKRILLVPLGLLVAVDRGDALTLLQTLHVTEDKRRSARPRRLRKFTRRAPVVGQARAQHAVVEVLRRKLADLLVL